MEPELDFNNYRIEKDYYNNLIADGLEQIQFQIQIIAQKFIDYENNKEKRGLMNNIGCHFSIIQTQLKLITDNLRK